MLDERHGEAHKAYLVEKINSALKDLGVGMRYKRGPETQPEFESLQGKKVVMVDDLRDVLADFAADLVVATDGNAEFVQCSGQDLRELVRQVLEKKPDIVLMDYDLKTIYTGTDVVRELSQQGFQGKVVGCSSDGISLW